jgi:hypothetical protein
MAATVSRAGRLDAILLSLVAATAFVCLVTPSFMTGDAVLYLDQMRQADLVRRCAHIGYYLVGIAVTWALPLDDTLVLNGFSAVVAGAGVGVVYVVARRLLESVLDGRSARLGACVAALAVALGRVWLEHAVFAQYIMLQTVLTWIAVWAWLAGASVLAGAVFGCALLTTPLAVLAAPVFLLRPFGWRDVVRLAVGVTLVYGPFLALRWEDLLWAPRGVLRSHLLDPGKRLGVAASAARVAYHTVLEFGPAVLLAPLGALAVWRTPAGRHLWAATLACFAILALFGTSRCSPWFFLPFYPLVAVLIGAAAMAGWESGRRRVAAAVVLVLLVLQGVASARALHAEQASQGRYRELVGLVERSRSPESLVLADWDHGLLFEHYTGRRPYSGTWADVGTGRPGPTTTPVAGGDALRSGRELWALDPRASEALRTAEGSRECPVPGGRVVLRSAGGGPAVCPSITLAESSR